MILRITDRYPTCLLFPSWSKELQLSSLLVDYLEVNELMPKLQSTYRKCHSTEIAVLQILSDKLTAMDNQPVTLLALLEPSIVSIMTSYCHTDQFRLGRYHPDRSQRVLFNGSLLIEIMLLFGVPQRSVLGPLLFLLYAAQIFDIIASFGLSGHTYADDSQMYISVPASKSQTAAACACRRSRSTDGVQQT